MCTAGNQDEKKKSCIAGFSLHDLQYGRAIHDHKPFERARGSRFPCPEEKSVNQANDDGDEHKPEHDEWHLYRDRGTDKT